MYFPENLRFLRKKNDLSQQQLADTLEIPRTTLGDYERGHTQPSMEMLLRIADIFHVKIDQLLRQKIRHKNLEVANDDGLRVLAITVNDDNEGNIELVDTTAEAGYLESFQDPEYIRDLPKIRFPNIPEGTYRGFEIRGDSMMPMESGTIVICKYVESLRDVKDHKTYVIVSQRDGLVYKRVLHHKDQQSLLLISDNESFAPYDIPYEEIKEIWAYHAHLSFSDIKQSFQSALEEKIADIQVKVNQLHQKYLNQS